MCNLKVEIAKKEKKLRGLRNEIAKTGNSLCNATKKQNFNIEEIQKITVKLHDLTEEADNLEREINLLKNPQQEPQLSPA